MRQDHRARTAGDLLLVVALLGVLWLASPVRAGAQGPPEMGWLGISISDVGEDLAERLAATFGPAAGTGVVVADVLKDGPAEQSSLKRGDVIVKMDAQPIWDVRQLQRAVRSHPVNQRVVLTVLRDALRLTVPVSVGAMPTEARAQLAGERFGFLVREGDEREPRRPQPNPGGRVFVAFVDADSPSSRAGLRPQDVILKVNDQPVQSLGDFERALGRSDRAVSLLVARRGSQDPIALSVSLPSR